MHARPHRWSATGHIAVRRLSAVALSVSLIALLAAIPAGSASASPPASTSTLTPPVGISSLPALSPELLKEITSGVPLSDLEVPQVTKLLASLPGISGLSGLSGLGGAKGLEQALTTAIDQVVGSGGKLGELLTPAILAPKLESALGSVLGPILGPQLKSLVELLLHKSPTATITEGLDSLNLNELLGSLLHEAQDPAQLIEQLLGALSPTKLEGLLGSTLTGTPFSQTTVGELASSVGTTTQALGEDLGTTLAPATMALTAPLTNGKLLNVLDELGGLKLSLLSGAEGTSGGNGSEGGNGSGNGSGGSGSGSGGSGGSGGGSDGSGTNGAGSGSATPTATTVAVSLPFTTVVPAAQPSSTSGPSGVKTKTIAKIKILSHRVRGKIVTIVVQVPAAGKVTLSGGHLKSASRRAGASERLTLKGTLTRAGTASLRKHRDRLEVVLRASFKPTSGSSSSATVTVTFA
jgi:hypothetical protein